MIIQGDWFVDIIKNYAPDLEYGVTFIPIPEQGRNPSTWTGGYAWAIPAGSVTEANSHIIKEAVNFILYGCGMEGQRSYCRDFNKAPTLFALSIEEGFYSPGQLYFREALSFARNRPPLSVGASYWDELSKAQDSVVRNLDTPLSALEKVEQKFP
jgi:multiple sugar transport system substrate-binding protein